MVKYPQLGMLKKLALRTIWILPVFALTSFANSSQSFADSSGTSCECVASQQGQELCRESVTAVEKKLSEAQAETETEDKRQAIYDAAAELQNFTGTRNRVIREIEREIGSITDPVKKNELQEELSCHSNAKNILLNYYHKIAENLCNNKRGYQVKGDYNTGGFGSGPRIYCDPKR
jgi:hypothetical protein